MILEIFVPPQIIRELNKSDKIYHTKGTKFTVQVPVTASSPHNNSVGVESVPDLGLSMSQMPSQSH